MASSAGIRTQPPQAFISTYAPRIRTYGNALLGPAIQPQNTLPQVRTTKRGTTAINYADDAFDDDDFDESEGPRRPTGLRSLRRDETSTDKGGQVGRHQKELNAPVDVQGIWRDWIGKPSKLITEKQHQVQCSLPLTLIPIKIDLDIPSFRPEAPLPAPANAREFGIDETLPAYRPGEPTPPYSLKDTFLWNLHEALTTPDQFARRFVEEMDFPSDRKAALVMQITNQIRSQLEEHAVVALHPLFQSAGSSTLTHGANGGIGQSNGLVQPRTPAHAALSGHSRVGSVAVAAPVSNGVSAAAEMAPRPSSEDIFNPDDAYRCIVNLNVNLRNQLYSDKFEWSLVHPPGAAEHFAKQTCADLGLSSEWVAALSHAIYEAVLKLRREVCENGTLGYGEIENESAFGDAGWRYDPETLGVQWEPSLEELTKEEIEKREYDRERQMRRARRETARFTNIPPPPPQNDYFAFQDSQDQPLGRGERRKTKRRFRSISPAARNTPDANPQGYIGGTSLRDDERQYWRCSHCQVWGSAVWAVRDGPNGPRTLCHNCGLLLERDKRLPPWSKDLFATELHHHGAAQRR